MSLRRLHRRLAVLMGVAGLVAFAGGAGFEPFSALLAAVALGTALFWQPGPETSQRMERIWLPLATLLVARALVHVFLVRDDVVIPVVDLLLLLMAAEALRSLDAPNDLRLYALSFALILASTAYRPGIFFLVAFVAYILLATLALLVGHVRRKAELHGVRSVPLERSVVTTTGILSGVIMMVSLVVFVTFPRVSRDWAGRGETQETAISGFSDEISLGEHGATILGNPQIVLRVEFPDGAPAEIGSLHWRGRSYDRFDGVRWLRSAGLPPSAPPSAWYRNRWGEGRLLRHKVFGASLDARVLFALHPTVDVDADNGIQPLTDNAGDLIYWGSSAPVYTAYANQSEPSPDELRATARGYEPSARHYLQLPANLDPRIPALADSLTAGLTNRYDMAVAIQSWLGTFGYTRDLPATARETSIEYFLFERRQGHCEYFSSAMVLLLRSLGIHARAVNGFLGGEWSPFGDYLVVTQNAAHSWVEVWFPEYGWVTFDPTPSGAGGGEQVAAWFWPGRIFFDGLQHRWSKWVLDYGTDEQFGIFAGLFEEREAAAATGSGAAESGGTGRYLGSAALVLLILAGIAWARRAGPPRSRTTAMYLELRAACGRAGVAVPRGLTPLALVDTVRRERARAEGPTARLVDLYLRSRYGGEELREAEVLEMREALGSARRLLRDQA